MGISVSDGVTARPSGTLNLVPQRLVRGMSSYIGMDMSHSSPVFRFHRCRSSPDHHESVHFLSREEIHEIKCSWNSVIGEDSGRHGIDILIEFFKHYPEVRSQYFGFVMGLTEEEMRLSPRLNQHASGVVLGVTQIINGLYNPLVVKEVAIKFASSHFTRGVRENNVRLLTSVIIDYIENNYAQPSGNIRDAYRKMFDFFLRAVAEKQNEMEMNAKKEQKLRTMKKNLKLLAVALVVLRVAKCQFFAQGKF